MSARTLVCFLAAAIGAAFAIGCERQPDYPVALLVTDDGLAGRWVQQQGMIQNVLEIRARPVPVKDGRTMRLASAMVDGNPEATASAYSILVQFGEHTVPVECSAFLIEFDGTRLLGAQVADAELDKSAMGTLVLPLHMLFKIERDGDTLTWSSLRQPIAWIPYGEWIDPPCDPPAQGGDAAHPRNPNALRLTNSLDRLVEVCREGVRRPDFWQADPMVFHREPQAPPPP